MKPQNQQKLAQAQAEVLDRLSKPEVPLSGVGGAKYVTAAAPGVEWLTVREHPDSDSGLVLVVPVDMHTVHLGPPDCDLTLWEGEPTVARCGYSLWVPAAQVLEWERVGYCTKESLKAVRQRLHQLATGQELPNDGLSTYSTPEYAEWEQELSELVGQLEEGLA